jgi:hypothetical protein
MKIAKKIFPTCFMSVIAVLCFVFLSPAFADMKKIDEAELTRTNASVTVASVKDRTTFNLYFGGLTSKVTGGHHYLGKNALKDAVM